MSFWTTWLPFGFLETSASQREKALKTPCIEEIEDFSVALTCIADGRQSKSALPLESEYFQGAIYSSRGRGYARYNEDAGALFRDQEGRVYAVALDQAGGLGGRIRGRASALAAEAILRGFQNLARNDSSNGSEEVDPIDAMLGAFLSAHKLLLDRKEGEVTTAVAAYLEPNAVYLVNSGDSGAVLFDRDGQMRTRSEMHEYPPPDHACLKHAVGLEPEGCEPTPYAWDLQPGDWLLMGSDGLLDSGMVESDELAKILSETDSAIDVVNKVCTLILRRMGTLRAKPDNLTVLLLRAKDHKKA